MEKNSIQNKIENALSSLDKVQRAAPKPFFYTRLMARLNTSHQNSWEKFSAFITQPAVAFSGIFLIAIMNIMAAYINLKTPDIPDQSEATVTDEYPQIATNFYDLENIKP